MNIDPFQIFLTQLINHEHKRDLRVLQDPENPGEHSYLSHYMIQFLLVGPLHNCHYYTIGFSCSSWMRYDSIDWQGINFNILFIRVGSTPWFEPISTLNFLNGRKFIAANRAVKFFTKVKALRLFFADHELFTAYRYLQCLCIHVFASMLQGS